MMTVAELIEELKTLEPDALVVLQKDAEGNGYSPLECVAGALKYEADSTWSGEVHDPETVYEGFEEAEEIPESAVECVVLCPVN